MEATFMFELGQIVYIDPVGHSGSPICGKVIGQTRWIDGTNGYVVAALPRSLTYEGVIRHHVHECELRAEKGS